MVREASPELRVGVTLNQYAGRERVLKNLLPKLAAGASFVQTQPVFGLDTLEPFARLLTSWLASTSAGQAVERPEPHPAAERIAPDMTAHTRSVKSSSR